MAQPGEIIHHIIPSKLFTAGVTVEFYVRVSFSFWDDNSYTIFDTAIQVAGEPECVIPYVFKSRIINAPSFKAEIDRYIKSIRTYELN